MIKHTANDAKRAAHIPAAAAGAARGGCSGAAAWGWTYLFFHPQDAVYAFFQLQVTVLPSMKWICLVSCLVKNLQPVAGQKITRAVGGGGGCGDGDGDGVEATGAVPVHGPPPLSVALHNERDVTCAAAFTVARRIGRGENSAGAARKPAVTGGGGLRTGPPAAAVRTFRRGRIRPAQIASIIWQLSSGAA